MKTPKKPQLIGGLLQMSDLKAAVKRVQALSAEGKDYATVRKIIVDEFGCGDRDADAVMSLGGWRPDP